MEANKQIHCQMSTLSCNEINILSSKEEWINEGIKVVLEQQNSSISSTNAFQKGLL